MNRRKQKIKRPNKQASKPMYPMMTFMGCGVGDLRKEILKSLYTDSREAALVTKGFLQVVPAQDDRYIGLALTVQGQEYLAPIEKYYAYI